MLEDSTPPKIQSYSLTSDLPSQQKPLKRSSGHRRTWMWVSLAILLLALVMGGLFLRSQLILRTQKAELAKQEAEAAEDPQIKAEAQAAELIVQLGKLIVLPDEKPTIATVVDLNELKGQPFFVNAKLGDKAFFYNDSKKIILYRPSENKIIEAITVTQTPVNTTPTETPAETPATTPETTPPATTP